jgi:hypothetical protein
MAAAEAVDLEERQAPETSIRFTVSQHLLAEILVMVATVGQLLLRRGQQVLLERLLQQALVDEVDAEAVAVVAVERVELRAELEGMAATVLLAPMVF